jgi:hypothetical protein
LKLSELFKRKGRAVIATPNMQGEVNAAVYAARLTSSMMKHSLGA